MSKINNAFCPNKDCKDYGLRNRDNTYYIERSNLNWRMFFHPFFILINWLSIFVAGLFCLLF